jgi:DNA-binding response OmpR family regulator
LDGRETLISDQPFKLLCLLAETAQRNDAFISNKDIDHHLWGTRVRNVSRPTRDVIRELKDSIARRADDCNAIRALIGARRNKGYRLALAPEQISIEE